MANVLTLEELASAPRQLFLLTCCLSRECYSSRRRLASTVTLTRFLPFDVRRCLTMLIRGRYVGACQMSVTGLED
jgi:hypothetical protein